MFNNKTFPMETINFSSSKNPVGDELSSKAIIDNMRIIKISKALGKIIKSFIVYLTEFAYRNNIRRELNTMPDYLLLDIGVQRDQINAIVSGHIVRETTVDLPAANSSSGVLKENQDDTPLAA
jgi:uncharacterized protein YjiS (DUF1127 family)